MTELENSQRVAQDLEESMRRSEQERRELEEARQRALEAKLQAEQAAHLEKEERERMVTICPFVFYTYV